MRYCPKRLKYLAGVVALLAGAATFCAARGNDLLPEAQPQQSLVGKSKRNASSPEEVAQAFQHQESLPGGASSLQESFQDWQVICSAQATTKHCSISQQQVDPKSRQRTLAIELVAARDGIDSVIVLPFGLKLDRGIQLVVDNTDLGPWAPFRTCLPTGCIVELTLDAQGVSALRAAISLRIDTVSDSEEEIGFTVSLKGFAAALDRAKALRS